MKLKLKKIDESVEVGGGATGKSLVPDPVGGKAKLPNSKEQGEGMQRLKDVTPGQSVGETDDENNTAPTGDNSAQNRASVAMKEETEDDDLALEGSFEFDLPEETDEEKQTRRASLKEELATLFGSELTEEFQDKALTLFEAAVASRVAVERQAIVEAAVEKIDQHVSEITESLVAELDKYVSAAAATWLEENQLAVETGLRTEIAENFMKGLKNLFAEHYIEVPEDKVDLVDQLAERVVELETKLNESIEHSMELESEIEQRNAQSIFEEATKGLTVVEAEKFATLAEGVEFNDAEDFKTKLGVIKEQYFGKKGSSTEKRVTNAIPLSEEFSGDTQEVTITGPMAQYVKAMQRTATKS